MVLAPMADVTDAAFRQIINRYGKPDLFYTEFVSADGLCSEAGRPKLLRDLYFTPAEHPIIGQIFGGKPENIFQAAKLIKELGFDGVDINMGCPDRGIEKQGGGASLIKNPTLAQEIIAAAKQGVGDLPVSIKTRIGYNTIEIETWTRALLEAKPAAIIFHLRTRKEMSKVAAHWDAIKIPVTLAKGSGTLILGNGDVKDIAEAHAKAAQYHLDGIMLGRAIFGNPWLFTPPPKSLVWGFTPSLQERLRVMVKHTKLFEELFGGGKPITPTLPRKGGGSSCGHTKSFAIMKKHFKAYVAGFDGASALRAKLMETSTSEEVEALVLDFLRNMV